ncbi:hypothetical protein GCM10018771_18210 [Streptomyces cellulosae]|nr:hypothetical protein GCM10018771_18210 [Streptomyces cellulosae]
MLHARDPVHKDGNPPTPPRQVRIMTDGRRTDRIGAAFRGDNPTVMRRRGAGFAGIGDELDRLRSPE